MKKATLIAVAATVDVALYAEKQGCAALSDVAERLDVSLSYLEQLFAKLLRGNIVRSYRGPGGGYSLAREACDISVYDIVTALDKSASLFPKNNRLRAPEGVHRFWKNADANQAAMLSQTSVAALMRATISLRRAPIAAE